MDTATFEAFWRFTRVEDGLTLNRYWASACPDVHTASVDSGPRQQKFVKVCIGRVPPMAASTDRERERL